MCLGRTWIPSVTWVTGILVVRERISSSALWWLGSRCCKNTRAMPVVSGKLASRVEKASRPPAEAPIPTTGKTLSRVEADVDEVTGREECFPRLGVERFFTRRTLAAGELKWNGKTSSRYRRCDLGIDTSGRVWNCQRTDERRLSLDFRSEREFCGRFSGCRSRNRRVLR